MSADLLRTAHESRFMRTRGEVDAFEDALARYAEHMHPDDLPRLYRLFEDATEHHEVMFGLVHLIERLPAHAWVSAFVQVLPTMMPNASEWADTVMARTLNGSETNPLLAEALKSTSRDGQGAATQLLKDLARAAPRPVGIRAQAMLASLPAQQH